MPGILHSICLKFAEKLKVIKKHIAEFSSML
jgi:hypothetical protein